MPLQLPEEDIDDLLYLSRMGELEDLESCINTISARENSTVSTLLLAARDPYSGNGPLHMAAANGHTGILISIIQALAVPSPQNETQLAILNAQNRSGNTALHWAALNGHLECVKVLIDSGANPTITNAAGHDAVYEAELNDKKEVVEWVLKESEGLEMGIGGEGSTEEGGNITGGEDPMEMTNGACQDEKLRAEMDDLNIADEKKGS